MDENTYIGLAIARAQRSGELLEESMDLLSQERYKSANNRAFYSIEKAIQSLLALKQITADTHSGCLKQFNMHFIRSEDGPFQRGDYKKIASVERIRTISDYDDFYIADKGECRQVVNNARDFYQKFLLYIEKYGEFSGHLEELKSYIDKGNTK